MQSARSSRFLLLFALGIVGAAGTLFACGDRTGLPIDDGVDNAVVGDAAGRLDGGRDAIGDALPALDVIVHPDADRTDCPDAGATQIYVITETFDLYSFYPPTLAFKRIGAISCPGSSGNTPFSMAVDRQGIARILFADGHLYRVSTATAACQPTPFQPNQSGFLNFGMGYVANVSDGGETLYVAGDGFQGGSSSGLATVDNNYLLHVIGRFSPPIVGAELTGTGGGQLFAFYSTTQGAGDSYIGQIDRQNAAVVGQAHLPLAQGSGWAFAFWGGDFWLFTSPNGGGSIVTRYRPDDNSTTQVSTLPSVVVGAGVSTCAPEQ